VYGGGGIMPDYFVPRDTSEFTPYLNKVVNYGYLYQFAFQYADRNRKTLSTFKDWKQMDKYLESQQLLGQFVAFAATKGVSPDAKQINVSKRFIENQLKSYITRNILGDQGFYPLFYKDDKTVLKALEIIRKQK